ncbi:hypothetical protein BHE74_00031688, partial [Ensete ventricosum]
RCQALELHPQKGLPACWYYFQPKQLVLTVSVKCRPLTEAERKRSRHIVQVTDDKVQTRKSLGVFLAGIRTSFFMLHSPQVQSADKILELLNLGNSRRKTESTEANATSSR